MLITVVSLRKGREVKSQWRPICVENSVSGSFPKLKAMHVKLNCLLYIVCLQVLCEMHSVGAKIWASRVFFKKKIQINYTGKIFGFVNLDISTWQVTLTAYRQKQSFFKRCTSSSQHAAEIRNHEEVNMPALCRPLCSTIWVKGHELQGRSAAQKPGSKPRRGNFFIFFAF